jgi:hypothetical protein
MELGLLLIPRGIQARATDQDPTQLQAFFLSHPRESREEGQCASPDDGGSRLPGLERTGNRECVMCSYFGKGLFSVLLSAFLAVSGFASPLSSRLLPLVPPGAQIVAGFQNPVAGYSHGRLLLATRNNRLDLEDFQALTGADARRVFDEIIEVALAPSGGALSEHMLLAAGRFDREQIFRSLELNGAANTQYQGTRIALIKPLTRELGDMLDTRWMVILDNRIAIFGTPSLVQEALRRYTGHALPDSILEERLSLLRPDVTSWNVLVGSAQSESSMSFEQPQSAWAQLQQDSDVLMVSARFGSKVRIDFSIHARAGQDQEFFMRKAGFFTDALRSGETREASPPSEAPSRLQNFSLESGRVQGSLELSSQQFSSWCDAIFLARVTITPPAANGD